MQPNLIKCWGGGRFEPIPTVKNGMGQVDSLRLSGLKLVTRFVIRVSEIVCDIY